jgi:hypothetical protein
VSRAFACVGARREGGEMESILETIQGLITKFFGSSAMAVIQSFIDKIIGLIGSIFGSLKPATS